MKKILNKCTIEDFEFLSETLGSRFAFIDDKGREYSLDCYKENPTEENKQILIGKIDSQIKYYAQADFAYLYRRIFNKDENITDEMIKDIAKKLKVKCKLVGSTEANLERLVKAVIEKEFLNKSPEELAEALRKLRLTQHQIDEIINEIKKIGKIASIPILIRILGTEMVLKIVESIIISFVASIIPREAAKAILKQFSGRNAFIKVLGPVAWAISIGWLFIDLQGPAFRKTIPICLYLGVVSLRDGTETGEGFWEEPSE